MAQRQPCRSTVSSRAIQQCRTCIGSTRPAKPFGACGGDARIDGTVSKEQVTRRTLTNDVSQVANKWLLWTGLAAAAAAMLIGRLGGPRNALIAMAVFAIIIAGHQFSLRCHGRNILS
jgi:hypothetical protein